MERKRVIVIGSGFGGLAAACRLAAKGHDVTLYEKRDKLGGRAYQYEINGFKFDGGPTVMTVPTSSTRFTPKPAASARITLSSWRSIRIYRIFNDEGRAFNYWQQH
jgi:phytoene desaturase